MKKRVVVTGLGALAPVGNNVADIWENIQNGHSGIGLIESFDTSGLTVKIAGEIKGFDFSAYIPQKDSKKMAAFVRYALVTGIVAIEDSGFVINESNAGRIGVMIGSGIGGIDYIENTVHKLLKKGARHISPFYIPASIINMASANLAIKYGLKGVNFSIVSACTTGANNIGEAARMIRYGDADIIIAGGTEMSVVPTTIAGFTSAQALSKRSDPQSASRPWDRDRDGFVLSSGAGVLVLEEYEHAKNRNANIYAELIGYGINSDAYHMTMPMPDGDSTAKCMLNALNDAQLNPEQIDYINAHGTSTRAGDLSEVRAIKRAFGGYANKLAISSTKSITGHLLGAAGSLESILSILALRDQVAPPTINLDNPGPECDLDFIPHEARQMKLDIVLSNSFGFGGTNASLIFKRFP